MTAPPAPPGAGDVKITWDMGYPKKANGKLKLKGKAEFKNGWSSQDGNVSVVISPTGGGVPLAGIATIGNGGVWELEFDLTDFGDGKQDWDIVPSVNAWKGTGTPVVTVHGPRKTMELP